MVELALLDILKSSTLVFLLSPKVDHRKEVLVRLCPSARLFALSLSLHHFGADHKKSNITHVK